MEQKNGFKAGESIKNSNDDDFYERMLDVMERHPEETNTPEFRELKWRLQRGLVNVTKKLEELEAAIKENKDAGKIEELRDEIDIIGGKAKLWLDDINGQIARNGVDVDDNMNYRRQADRLRKIIEDVDNALEKTKDSDQQSDSDFKIPEGTTKSEDAPKPEEVSVTGAVPAAVPTFEIGNPEDAKIKVVPVEEKHFEIVEPEDEDTPEDEGIFDDDEDEREYDDDNEEEEKAFVFGNLNQQRAYERLMRKSNERSKEGSRNALKKTAKKWGIRAALVGLGVLLAFGASKLAGGRSSEKMDEEQTVSSQSSSTPEKNSDNFGSKENNNDDNGINDKKEDDGGSDAEDDKGYEVPDIFNVNCEDENGNKHTIEINWKDLSGNYGEKLDRNMLDKPGYDYKNIDSISEIEIADEITENLFHNINNPVVAAQILAALDSVKFDENMNGVVKNSFADLNNLLQVAQQDEELREHLTEVCRKYLYDKVMEPGAYIKLIKVKAGETYDSLCITNKAGDGEMEELIYTNMEPEAAPFDHYVWAVFDKDGRNIFNTNEFGGEKHNFLSAAGVISETATKGEAQEIMFGTRILGISGLCSQIEWQEVGYESSASKWDEYFVPPVTEENPPVEIPPIVEEPPIETPPVVEEPPIETPPVVEEPPIETPPIETPPSMKGKTEEKVEDGRYITKLPVTPESATQDKTVVTEQETGQINTQVVNSSSEKAEENFLNGGDQGGGNTDADGGGSTNVNTEATYNPTNTEGWQGVEQSKETGTQDVAEPVTPEEVNQINNSEANTNTVPSTSLEQGDREAPNDAQKANMMSDMF